MKTITQLSIRNLLAATLISAAFNSHAAIIDYGSFLSDSATGLDWLDVTTTVNRSFNDVSNQFGTGGDFQGWRYATGSEFNTLLFNWTGIPAVASGRTFTSGTTPSVDGLVIMLGSTLDSWWVKTRGQTWDSWAGYAEGEGQDYTWGIIADKSANNNNQIKVAAIWDSEIGNRLDFFNSNDHQFLALDASQDNIGSFLVRGTLTPNNGANSPSTSVSEPHSFLLLTLGLIGIGLTRKREDKKF